ncbi:MAG: hypothetical protein ACI9DE_002925, partial [Halioglobus sp.]
MIEVARNMSKTSTAFSSLKIPDYRRLWWAGTF